MQNTQIISEKKTQQRIKVKKRKKTRKSEMLRLGSSQTSRRVYWSMRSTLRSIMYTVEENQYGDELPIYILII